jgi:2-polyprenyl-6-methoxyphenol hydroxylase-like FAD-dependent oxidoreductase
MALEPVDVAVIGAGPAGAAAARLLASWGHGVALVGRATSRRQLAESLPPSCTKLFERLGIRSAIDRAEFVHATGNTVQWAGRDKRVEYFDAGAYGYQVQRSEFDALLLSAATATRAVVHRDATARDVERDGDVWSVSFDASATDERDVIRARWLLDCSGRTGVIARRGWRRGEASSRTTAVVGVWEREGPWALDDDTHTVVESYDGGWAWSVPISTGRRYVTVMLDPSVTDVPGKSRLADAYRAELSRTTLLSGLVEGASLVRRGVAMHRPTLLTASLATKRSSSATQHRSLIRYRRSASRKRSRRRGLGRSPSILRSQIPRWLRRRSNCSDTANARCTNICSGSQPCCPAKRPAYTRASFGSADRMRRWTSRSAK